MKITHLNIWIGLMPFYVNRIAYYIDKSFYANANDILCISNSLLHRNSSHNMNDPLHLLNQTRGSLLKINL